MTYLIVLLVFFGASLAPESSWGRNNFIIGGNTTVDASGKGVSKWEIRNSSGALISTGDTDTERIEHCAVRLSNGNVFVAGGHDVQNPGESGQHTPNSTTWEIRSPIGGLVAKGSNLNAPRVGSACVRLNNGNVMIVGGYGLGAFTLEIRTPTGAFVVTRSFWTGRAGATATLLANGNVMIVGGVNASGTWETYDSNGNFVSGTNTTGRYLWSGRNGHCAVLLPNGNIFLGGGMSAINWEIRTDSSALVTANYFYDSRGSGHTCNIMGGNIFIAGGGQVPTSWEIRNASGGLVSTARNLQGWNGHTATVQTDTGNILLVYDLRWEIRSPSGAYVSNGTLQYSHTSHTVTEL